MLNFKFLFFTVNTRTGGGGVVWGGGVKKGYYTGLKGGVNYDGDISPYLLFTSAAGYIN